VAAAGLTDMDEIVPDDKDEALEENDLLDKNIPVETEPNDNHEVHITIHQYDLLTTKLAPDQVQRRVAHIEAHKKWRLAADPDMIEKLTQNPTPPPLPSPQTAVSPTEGSISVPNPNAAVSEQGLVRQMGQALNQAVSGSSANLPIAAQGESNA